MLLFAHLGITLGAGILLDKLLTGSNPFSIKNKFQFSSPKCRCERSPEPSTLCHSERVSQSPERSEGEESKAQSKPYEGGSEATSQDCSSDNPGISPLSPKKHLDYRFLLIGSLLPDLIDKPIGGILLYQTFQNGRIFAHTLCFTIFLALLGAYVYRRWKKSWFLILSFGSAIHLILDGMWLDLHTLLWPIYGWSFPKFDTLNFFAWLPEMFHILATEPIVYISELIGFAILAWATVRLIQTKKIHTFIANGLAE